VLFGLNYAIAVRLDLRSETGWRGWLAQAFRPVSTAGNLRGALQRLTKVLGFDLSG